jgi:hypothetical protein
LQQQQPHTDAATAHSLNKPKKSTNAQTLQRKTTVLVAFFLFWFSVNPLPISSVLVQNAGAARLL